jgi:hypothetical protein
MCPLRHGNVDGRQDKEGVKKRVGRGRKKDGRIEKVKEEKNGRKVSKKNK